MKESKCSHLLGIVLNSVIASATAVKEEEEEREKEGWEE
jgi:hypothetical protein